MCKFKRRFLADALWDPIFSSGVQPRTCRPAGGHRRTAALGFFSLTFADYFPGVFVRTRFPRGGKNVAFTVRTVKGGRVKLILTEGHISIIVALEVARLN